MKELPELDIAELLDSEEVMAEYLSVAAEDPNPDIFLAAIADVAKARGMAKLALESGLGRESLYKALRPGSKPRYETIAKILAALDVKMQILPAKPEHQVAAG